MELPGSDGVGLVIEKFEIYLIFRLFACRFVSIWYIMFYIQINYIPYY